MYARITRTKADPARLDAVVGALRDQMVPVFKQQRGYLGAVSIANRETGEGATTTYWDSWDNLKASEAAIFAARDQFAQDQQADIVSFHRCEVPVLERAKDPQAGTFVRATVMSGIPADRIDAGIENFRARALPTARSQPGFRGSVLAVDRENGVAFATSSWDTAELREASDSALRDDRSQATAALGGNVETQLGEVTFAELTVPAHS